MAAGGGAPPRSVRWGYVRIITGTILGGVLGFYVMHLAENSYKEKMKQRLAIYERELMMKQQQKRTEGDSGDGHHTEA